ncbi:unnamed protein product [Urochloa humidicola]
MLQSCKHMVTPPTLGSPAVGTNNLGNSRSMLSPIHVKVSTDPLPSKLKKDLAASGAREECGGMHGVCV